MRRTGWLAGALALLMAIVGIGFTAASAAAGTSVGSFEIDGNTPDNPSGEPTDWDAQNPNPPAPPVQTPPLTITPFSDGTGRNDDSFGMGSKQEEPGGWACITGSSPAKGDVTPGGKVAFRTINGKQFVYVNFTRKETTGSADIDYEFNQSAEPNPACPALSKRTPGDIVLAFDATNGGANIMVRAFSWTGSATLGSFVPLATGSQGVTWDGATNGDGSNKTGNFGEAVLNLTDTIGEVACGEFSSVFMKSRSAVEINSALQDRTAKKPVATGLCPVSSMTKGVRNFTTNPTGTYSATASAVPGDTVQYQIQYSNAGPGVAHNVVVTDTLDPKQSFVDGSCTQTSAATCTYDAGTRTVKWVVGDVPAGVTHTFTFKAVLTGPFTLATTPVKNTAVATNTEEGSKPSNETTVNVNAAPNSTLDKKVRNASVTGSTFQPTASAKPGDTLVYQITYLNTGPGTAFNVVVKDPVPQNSTYQSCTGGTSCSMSSGTVTWNLGDVVANDPKVLTFTVKLADAFPNGSTQVKNTATVTSTLETTPKPSNEVVVTVTAAPVSSLTKGVRNSTVSPTGTFSTSTSASPGNTIDYQIVYTNTGDANATNVVVSDPLPDHSNYVSCSGGNSCGLSGSTITWNIASVAAKASVTLGFRVTLKNDFTAGLTTIPNVATGKASEETSSKSSNQATVNVTTASNLTIAKSASKTTANGGDTITYTITYGNSGSGAATGTTITDTLPAGTEFVECGGTPTCTVTGSDVKWTIGSVAAGATGLTVTLTVRVTASADCQICNVAKIQSPLQNANAAVSSNSACTTVTPSSDPSTAKANGSALGLKAYVPLLSVPLLNAKFSEASSSQTGVGQDADDDELLDLDLLGVVGLASIADIDVLRTNTQSRVSQTLGARQTSVSEVVGVNVLSGLVTADVIRSVATASANGNSSSISAAGTTATNLRIAGQSVANVAPGTEIPLNEGLWGDGAHVVVNAQSGSTSGPAAGQTSGGTYKADQTVTGIQVKITGGLAGGLLVLGGPPVEITIAQAIAHAEHKQTRLCGNQANRSVSGHAFIASAEIDPLQPTATVGFVDIPASGGHANKGVTAAVLPSDGSVVNTADAVSDSLGTITNSQSSATSYAQAANVCVLRLPNCIITATLVKSQANSSARSSTRGSDADGTQFLNLVVAGIPISGTPAPNTVIRLPLGLGYVVLNQQVPDGPETGHTGLTVSAIVVHLNLPLAPLLRGAEVIVAQAHSDATYR